ncbi:39S ribosomal protein L55, mitochondrial isoform X2 [Falco peregrinus]|uniref:39S ribosomal protein L55, mitochondrial isoform X2 n=1 Tax=Falco peregrinus TaxID=8954 RepID=UPI00247AC40E|nr:39S ribosomal protein L55, mitochondrial isoform X2 [Falco peregrinus]
MAPRSRRQLMGVGGAGGVCEGVPIPAAPALPPRALTSPEGADTRLPHLVLYLPGAYTEDLPLLTCAEMAAASQALRQLYGRLYPVLLVKTDGSTIHLRYKEPKKILMLPLDSSTLPEAERKARLRRQFPSRAKAKPEETFEAIDMETYKRFWKK